MLCAFCGEHLELRPSSDEHVIPRALGGNTTGSKVFRTRVHRDCNSRAGREVDAEFSRSWLGQNVRGNMDWSLATPGDGRRRALTIPAPGAFQDGDRVGDLWGGPPGFHAVHFHRPYPKTSLPGASYGPPVNLPTSAIDPGYILMFTTTVANPRHGASFVSSLRNFFDGAPIYYGPGPEPATALPACPPEHRSVYDQVLASIKQVQGTFSVTLGSEYKLAAKVALGLAANLLGQEFLATADADRLRRLLWVRDMDQLEACKDEGSCFGGLFDEDRQMVQLMGLDAYHIATLQPTKVGLVMILMTYGHSTGCVVTKDASAWQDRLPGLGAVAAIRLRDRTALGPVPLAKYLEWRSGNMPQPLSSFFGAPPSRVA